MTDFLLVKIEKKNPSVEVHKWAEQCLNCSFLRPYSNGLCAFSECEYKLYLRVILLCSFKGTKYIYGMNEEGWRDCFYMFGRSQPEVIFVLFIKKQKALKPPNVYTTSSHNILNIPDSFVWDKLLSVIFK